MTLLSDQRDDRDLAEVTAVNEQLYLPESTIVREAVLMPLPSTDIAGKGQEAISLPRNDARSIRRASVTEETEEEPNDLDVKATVLLAIQQASSSFSYRAAEFAYPLFLVVLYTNTLLPASLYGFITTASAILFSGSVGTLIDRWATQRLRVVRAFILAQKLLVSASYALFILLFLDPTLKNNAMNGGNGSNSQKQSKIDVWSIFSVITGLGCILILSNVGVSVGVERDWVTSIAAGSSRRLTRLNAIMRRIDLLSKLLAPLFVSLLTTTAGYATSGIVLLAMSTVTTIFELSFIGTVFRRFKVLGEEEARTRESRMQEQLQIQKRNGRTSEASTYPPMTSREVIRENGTQGALTRARTTFLVWSKMQYKDWKTFAAMPIFISSITIALLYMSVLSFDSTFIAYLKSETTYSDPFIAGMRGVCVVAGLLGTFVSPMLTGRIGLVRTGSWSLWAELLPLTPVIISLYVGATDKDRPAWNTTILFGGLALSRIGLWSFDLAQLAQVQSALSQHPRRNSIMALQFSLQNLLDLAHYGLTLGWSRPRQFKNAADVSYAAIGIATLLYVLVYARRERGHILHLDKLGLQILSGRKRR